MAKSKRYRPRLQVINACTWCGAAFAKEMRGGFFCHDVCKIEYENEQRTPNGTYTPRIAELIEDAEDNLTE